MTIDENCEKLARLTHSQFELCSKDPGAFMAGAILAGAFVAFATILSLTVGSHLDLSVRPLVMGSVFGVGTLLVIFGGGELFTGQSMFAAFALVRRTLSVPNVLRLLAMSWSGNLLGAVIVCILFATGGGGHVYATSTLLHDLVAAKTQSPIVPLFSRAILCNILACLGIWSASRIRHDGGKIVLLAWCVMAYVTCGLDHSIANMATFTLGVMAPVAPSPLFAAVTPVIVVSLGNALGGALLAVTYSFYSRSERRLAAVARQEDSDFRPAPHLPETAQAILATVARQGLAKSA